jgi:protein TonB
MEMYKTLFTSMGFAILINILLFAFLPLFIEKGLSKSDLETLIPVNVINFKRPKPPPPEEKKEKSLENKRSEKIIPTVRLNPHKRFIHKKLEMEMPRLSFEINPRLAGGMPVAAPAEGPTIFGDFYDQAEVDQMPVAIFKMKPVYPYRARRLNIAGKVDVRFLVNKEGYVSNVKVLKSTRPGMFDDSVRKALASWRFSPGKVHGQAVSTWVITTIKFRLEGT